MSDMAGFRKHFPGADLSVFMNVAQRGLVPIAVRDAIHAYLEGRVGDSWSKERSFELAEATRRDFAHFVNAEPDEIAFTKNVSDGINMVAGGIRWRSGDNVVLCAELEHPANVFPWYNVHRREGVEVRVVPPREGGIHVEGLVDAIDGGTRVVTVPSVTFAPGFVTPVRRLADACHERGTRLVVDAAQSVGILQTDVRALGCDALAVATQKGLLACYGQGFLYCKRDFAEEMVPAALARFGVALEEEAHETALAGETFLYAPGARRFDGGNFNYLGLVAVREALRLLDGCGMGAIEAYVRARAHDLATGFLDAGLPLCGGTPGDHIGHIVSIGDSGGGRHYTADDPAMNRLYEALTEANVVLSIRRGVLRFSLHAYNNEGDVDRVLEVVRSKR
jgi:selenocysteine lyase/cysteine desulfurase